MRLLFRYMKRHSGLGPGEPVESMEVPMSVELGPGLITSIYDGIQRPLDDIMKISGNSLKRGVEVPSLKRNLKWEFVPTAKVGDEVEDGRRDRYGAGDACGTAEDHGSLWSKRERSKRSKQENLRLRKWLPLLPLIRGTES